MTASQIPPMSTGKVVMLLLGLGAVTLAAALLSLSACRADVEITKTGELARAEIVQSFSDGGSPAREVAFSPDNLLLATSSASGTVNIRRLSDRKIVRTLKHPGGVTSLSFSPDATWLVTGGYEGTARIWDISSGQEMETLRGHVGTIWAVDVSSDGRQIVSAGEDKVVRLWRAVDGVLLKQLKGHDLNVWDVRFSPDGKQISSSGFDRLIKIWDAGTGKLVRDLSGHEQAVVGLAYSPDGRLLASGSDDSTVRIWRSSDGALVQTLANQNHAYQIDFSGDGKWIASAGRARNALGTLWHQVTGVGGASDAIRLWRVEDGALMQMLKLDDDAVSVAFSEDGKWLANASENSRITLWRLQYAESDHP